MIGIVGAVLVTFANVLTRKYGRSRDGDLLPANKMNVYNNYFFFCFFCGIVSLLALTLHKDSLMFFLFTDVRQPLTAFGVAVIGFCLQSRLLFLTRSDTDSELPVRVRFGGVPHRVFDHCLRLPVRLADF